MHWCFPFIFFCSYTCICKSYVFVILHLSMMLNYLSQFFTIFNKTWCEWQCQYCICNVCCRICKEELHDKNNTFFLVDKFDITRDNIKTFQLPLHSLKRVDGEWDFERFFVQLGNLKIYETGRSRGLTLFMFINDHQSHFVIDFLNCINFEDTM